MEQQLIAWFWMWFILELSNRTKISKTALIWMFAIVWWFIYQILSTYYPDLLDNITFLSKWSMLNAWLVYITLNKANIGLKKPDEEEKKQ